MERLREKFETNLGLYKMHLNPVTEQYFEGQSTATQRQINCMYTLCKHQFQLSLLMAVRPPHTVREIFQRASSAFQVDLFCQLERAIYGEYDQLLLRWGGNYKTTSAASCPLFSFQKPQFVYCFLDNVNQNTRSKNAFSSCLSFSNRKGQQNFCFEQNF